MAKQKYYVVWEGHVPGVYTSWAQCQQQTNGFTDAKFKSYETQAAAEQAYKDGWKKHWGRYAAANTSASAGAASAKPRRSKRAEPAADEQIEYNSISVDVGTNGNPGPVEYKGVDTQTGDILFAKGPIRKGTNNLGEFLAIVHALAYLKQEGSDKVVYSDSLNAIKWVRERAVSSTLVRDESTKEIWGLVDRAVQWLRTNTYETEVRKWQTRQWGEIKADYGRK